MKILLVDDDVDILEVLQLTFGSAGYETRKMTNGKDIDRIVAEFKPDAILLDVLLSGQDGRTICKELKSKEESKDIPIIMVSAHPEAGANIKEYGADAFVEKPFDIFEIVERVGSYIKK